MKKMSEPRSKCCGATVMSAEGHSVYCSKCGGICEIMSPEYDRIERMLKWIIMTKINDSNPCISVVREHDFELLPLPNIDDIIEEK